MSEVNQPSVGKLPSSQPALNPKSLRRRLGCWLGLVLWFVLLLLPCFAAVLISQGEITVQLGDAPGQNLRVWLIQDATERGVGIARPSVHENPDSQVCLQTDTSFVLWMGKGEATSYCECYVRQGDSWTSVSSAQGHCGP